MKRFESIAWKKYAPLLFMLVFPLLGWMYKLTNRPDQNVYSLATSIDQAIPFVKYLSVPYSVWIVYIYACLIYFFRKDVNTYYRGIVTYTVCALICYFVYSVFQTTVIRPVLTGTDSFTQLMMYIYDRDQPYNCFPSIHCFSSYMVMRMVWTGSFRNKRNVTLITGMSSLIMISTLLVKQHVIMDLLGAVLLVEIVVPLLMLGERLVRVTRERQNNSLGA